MNSINMHCLAVIYRIHACRKMTEAAANEDDDDNAQPTNEK